LAVVLTFRLEEVLVCRGGFGLRQAFQKDYGRKQEQDKKEEYTYERRENE
jgi:hypothetical protein